jgi:hypothetical protein
MQMRIKHGQKRYTLKTVGIREDVRARLQRHIYAQNPRPVTADVVSIAVSEYIDRQERRKETA